MYCGFRLNPEYDTELINYLNARGNRSRAIRQLLRIGFKATADSKDVVFNKSFQETINISPEKQKNQPKILNWKI